MRPIVLAEVDKRRPVVILTREAVRLDRTRVTVAPITTRVRGIRTEVKVGPTNGLDHDSVVNCDNIVTIEVSDLGPQLGFLLDSQEPALAAAIQAAFDLTLD
ncbi:MAG TPA: type II toxin-antitoxin system PemK/MazF family toxin [Terrimesophilobacter sp.]|nr:type II toxin-antitoxin system PemK/MazF family toxin [Terrimesophilobacter sp.]